MYVCIYVLYVCVYIYIYIYVCLVCVYIYIYIYIYVCVYIYIYIYIPKLQTPIVGHGAKYTYYGICLPQPCPPPSNLSATTREKTLKVPSRKGTMHCPAPRCDSLKVRPMATSERKRVYWQLKTGLRRVHILQNKKKNNSAVDKKKRFYKTSVTDGDKNLRV